ncbi:acyltransferase [Geofilum rhodophaeum]|uniref:acyltransferase n=1 Tax=Geofilum rhodophaeum TaxID=1965019 RepID=UPI000B525E30|nr:acyltransferase [Geofilum rhodophaeum]
MRSIFKELLRGLIFFEWLDWLFNRVSLKLNRVAFCKGLVINGRVYIRNKGVFKVGRNFRLNSGIRHNVIGGDSRSNFIVEREGKLIIGHFVGISNSTFICHDSITIENSVLIGGGCKFYDTDFHSIVPSERLQPYLNGMLETSYGAKSGPILIKEGAWIGAHCILLKGVEIGRNAVIAAGSVVSKSIPENEIWGGNPIRFIKKI